MSSDRDRRAARLGALATLAVLVLACTGPAASRDAGLDDARADAAPARVEAVDLLLVVDNSGSMRENQENFVAQLQPALAALIRPPDRDGDGTPDHAPLRDLHVGVVSTDLGTANGRLGDCDNSDVGDDGMLNPIRYGPSMQRHQPWEYGVPDLRPADCTRADQFPPFLAFPSDASTVEQFAHDVHCNAALYVFGCGIEQPLEAAYRAIVWRRADDRPDNTTLYAGFLRENALLVILVLSDEEDGSVRDCRFAEDLASCQDATAVFQSFSPGWASSSMNMRFYMYRPCSAEDPTWPLDRYIDPRNPHRGFLGLKPGHPERVIFAAITGVPLQVPTVGSGASATTDWDRLLGPPGPGGSDDYCGRMDSLAFDDPSNPEGPVSMRQANRDPDPNCSDRVMPACRREGSAYDPANPPCSPTEQYFAWPSRRIVEVARRFDEAPLCEGRPCRNGLVASTCARNFASAMGTIVERIQQRLAR